MIDVTTDDGLEGRLRVAYREMVPKLVDAPAHPEVWAGDHADHLVDTATARPLPPRRSFIAAGLLVAAAVVGLVVVAQRDPGTTAPADVSTAISPAGDGAPTWYEMMRPLIPERFEYAALVAREPSLIGVVAVGSRDGKALEITLTHTPDLEPLGPSTTLGGGVVDDVGDWIEAPQGWTVRVADTGLTILVTCDIGARGRDFEGPPNYCDMDSAGAFTKADIRSVARAFATHFDATLFESDIGVPTDRDVNAAAVSAMIGAAIPEQSPIADTDWGYGDRVFDFSVAGQFPDTSVRVLQNLYPPPPVSDQPGYGLYDDAAAFWKFGDDGLAVRISSTDTSPDRLARLEQLSAALIASDSAFVGSTEPLKSALDPRDVSPPLTTIIVQTTSSSPAPQVDPHLLPATMPEGFDDIAEGFRTDAAGSQSLPAGQAVHLFAGPGEQPVIVMVFSYPAPAPDVELGQLEDFTQDASWPAYRLGIVHPSGRYDNLLTGGLAADEVQRLADQLPDGEVNGDLSLSTSAFDLTEVTWTHDPSLAHGITWTGEADREVTMFVEQPYGLDVIGNGISWPVRAIQTPVGRVFASVDPLDPTLVQAGVVVGGQAVNFEALNMSLDELVAMAASIAPTPAADWIRRVPGA